MTVYRINRRKCWIRLNNNAIAIQCREKGKIATCFTLTGAGLHSENTSQEVLHRWFRVNYTRVALERDSLGFSVILLKCWFLTTWLLNSSPDPLQTLTPHLDIDWRNWKTRRMQWIAFEHLFIFKGKGGTLDKFAVTRCTVKVIVPIYFE